MKLLELTNTKGMQVTIASFGARIASVLVPKDGELLEMTVTPDDKTLLTQDPFYLGATCGPVCNRISNASFAIEDTKYQLSQNDGENCLHSGDNNISLREWQIVEHNTQKLVLRLSLEHLENGFPGNRVFTVCYQLSDNNELTMDYQVSTDQTTPVNMTNHAYFNLGEKSANDLYFKLDATNMLERHGNGIPTGKQLPITTLGFDFNQWTKVDDVIENTPYQQIVEEQGIDHCFVMNKNNRLKAQLLSKQHNIQLSVYSDQSALQLYTGKFLAEPYIPYQGLCFECQGFTDAVNQPEFESVLVSPEEDYNKSICYRFDVL